jgi:hypothetical protein
MVRRVLALAALAALAAPALADDGPRYHHHYRHHIYLPPERHVVEVVQPPWSGRFIINGSRFTGLQHACRHWAAGERIKLIEGDWNGRCITAVFYNFRHHSTCEMSCGGW